MSKSFNELEEALTQVIRHPNGALIFESAIRGAPIVSADDFLEGIVDTVQTRLGWTDEISKVLSEANECIGYVESLCDEVDKTTSEHTLDINDFKKEIVGEELIEQIQDQISQFDTLKHEMEQTKLKVESLTKALDKVE